MSGFNINRTIQSGNLTRDPELRSLPSGTSVCQVGVAVNERYKNNATGEWDDRPNYFDWTIWGGIGEWVAANLRQGDAVTLEGRARWHSWENNEGQKRSKVDFVADSIVPPRSGSGNGFSARNQRQAEQAAGADFAPRSDIPSDADFSDPIGAGGGPPGAAPPDDDIPF